MSKELTLAAAHSHAANAEDFLSQGLLIPASEEHAKAAEAFQACVDNSSDENTKRTLRMLYNEHLRASKDLQRRIQKLREENKDPSLPQPKAAASPPAKSSAAAGPSRAIPSPPPLLRNSGSGRLNESQLNVDESFMVLGQRSDPGDAFNVFWRTMDGVLDQLNLPVAFATAPLPSDEAKPRKNSREAGSSSDTDMEETITTRLSRGLDRVKTAGSRVLSGDVSFGAPRTTGLPQASNSFADDDEDLDDGFFVVPSTSDSRRSEKENTNLKVEVESLKKRLAAAERVIQMRREQDQSLRESIVIAKQQAQRAMGASMIAPRPPPAMNDFGSVNMPGALPLPPPIPNAILPNRDRESSLQKRVKELEEELRVVRADNEKQRAMITRFREKWDKLKENARKKKEAKAAAGMASSPVHEKIVEEPEEED